MTRVPRMAADAQSRHYTRNVLQTRPLLILAICSLLGGVCTVFQNTSETHCIERINTGWTLPYEYFFYMKTCFLMMKASIKTAQMNLYILLSN